FPVAELRQDVHSRQHAVVGTPEVTEVVVRRVFTAEDRTGLAHLVFDERVPDPGANGCSAGRCNGLRYRTRGDEVVQHRDVGLALGAYACDLALGNDRGDGRRRNCTAGLVDDEAAVSVAVKG